MNQQFLSILRTLLVLISCILLAFISVGSSGNTWQETKHNKKGSVVVKFYNNEQFISNSSGKLKGIEFELLSDMFRFIENNYQVELDIKWELSPSFGELYREIKDGKDGMFGACSFSITEKRLKEVSFSPKYMPDIEVMITSNNFPIVKDTTEFIEVFKNATALNVANTTYEEDLNEILTLLPNLNVENVKYASEIQKRLATEDNLISFIELPNYLLNIQKGAIIKRQRLFKFERMGYGFIYPINSDWNVPVNVYFDSDQFTNTINFLIKKYFGDDVNDLLWKVESESIDKKNEIDILTKEKEYQNAQLKMNQLELQKRKLWQTLSLIGILFIVVVAILFYNSYRIKKNANEKLAEQNEEISKQKVIVEEKNKEIIDSINYAKHIQHALLKDQSYTSEHLPENFTFFEPRDIVSGDFYWVQEKGNFLYITVADCTGHGVPGAFLTMLGTAFLNEINTTTDFLKPNEILELLRDKIIKELKQQDKLDSNKDGMDMALVRLNLSTLELDYAGANNPLWIIRKGKKEMEKITADKQPVAYFDYAKPFTNHTVQLNKDDIFYLFSDGYADQFGGKRGKKLKYKRFQEYLEEMSALPLAEQHSIIKQRFFDWKGPLEQIDDVCVMGVKV